MEVLERLTRWGADHVLVGTPVCNPHIGAKDYYIRRVWFGTSEVQAVVSPQGVICEVYQSHWGATGAEGAMNRLNKPRTLAYLAEQKARVKAEKQTPLQPTIVREPFHDLPFRDDYCRDPEPFDYPDLDWSDTSEQIPV